MSDRAVGKTCPVRLDRSRGGKEPIITPNNDGGWFEVVGTQEEYDEARVFRANLRASRWCWLRRRWTLGLVWVKHRLGMDSLHEGRQCATPDFSQADATSKPTTADGWRVVFLGVWVGGGAG